MGNNKASVYLASPVTCAVSALKGCTDPESFLKWGCTMIRDSPYLWRQYKNDYIAGKYTKPLIIPFGWNTFRRHFTRFSKKIQPGDFVVAVEISGAVPQESRRL